jgi:hypothetical protein
LRIVEVGVIRANDDLWETPKEELELFLSGVKDRIGIR